MSVNLGNVEQRLVQLEICAAKLAELKTDLRRNYEKTQFEISQVMSAEVAMIRSRENQLLKELSGIHYSKEDRISQKQAVVHNAIGACQQSILTSQPLPIGLVENALLEIDEDVRIEFEADIDGSHDQIATLGNIRTLENCQREKIKRIGETLPLEYEKYDDDSLWLMCKKSCPIVGSQQETPHEVDTVKGWLSRLPSNKSALHYDLNQFVMESDSSEINSDFEIPPKQTGNEVLSAKFIENLERPVRDWLAKVSNSAKISDSELPPAPIPASFRTSELPSSSKNYKFEEVIKNVHSSGNEKWIHNDESDIETITTMSSETNYTIIDREKQESAFDESYFISNLSKLFGRTLSSFEDSNRQVGPEDIQLWRNITTQMQNDRKWLME